MLTLIRIVPRQVKSLMGSDVDYINEQITKVTRLPNAPERSQPHLGNTGHLTQQQQQQQQQQVSAGQMRGLGSFSVVVPIYLGAIFVFFIYIVAKVSDLRRKYFLPLTFCLWQIMLKKLDNKEVEVEVDVTQAYKDDGW